MRVGSWRASRYEIGDGVFVTEQNEERAREHMWYGDGGGVAKK